MSQGMNQIERSNDKKRVYVHERLKVLVSYDNEQLGDDLKDDAT